MEVISYLNGKLLQKNDVVEIKDGEIYETYIKIMGDVRNRISTKDKKPCKSS